MHFTKLCRLLLEAQDICEKEQEISQDSADCEGILLCGDLPRGLGGLPKLPGRGDRLVELIIPRVRAVAHGAGRARRGRLRAGLEAATRVAAADATGGPDGGLARVL